LAGRGRKGFVEPEVRKERRFSISGSLFRELDKEVPETELQGMEYTRLNSSS